MPTLAVTWHAVMDERTCPICTALNGYTWFFDVGKDELDDSLIHSQFGVVWSLTLGSAAHSRGYLTTHGYNCRCNITYKIDLSDVKAKVQALTERVRAAAAVE